MLDGKLAGATMPVTLAALPAMLPLTCEPRIVPTVKIGFCAVPPVRIVEPSPLAERTPLLATVGLVAVPPIVMPALPAVIPATPVTAPGDPLKLRTPVLLIWPLVMEMPVPAVRADEVTSDM